MDWRSAIRAIPSLCQQSWRLATGLLLSSALLTPTVTASAGAAFSPMLQETKVSEVARSLNFTPQYVALRIGVFEEEGIKISLKTTWGSQGTMTEVLSGGSNIGLLGPEAASFTVDAGPTRRLMNFAQLTNRDGSFIIAKSPMTNFKLTDLKGKTIVTSGAGSTPALVLVHLIKKAGLDPKRDVNIRNIPVSANIIPSFRDPQTQFAQAAEPMPTRAILEGGAYRVAAIGDLLGPVPFTAYMATLDYIERNPTIIQGFTNAVYRALLWTESHTPEQIAEAVAPYFKGLPVELIRSVVTEYKKIKSWAPDPLIRPEGMNKMVDLVIEGGILKQRVPYQQIVNPKFAERALQTVKR